ncbi:MAG: glycosyltransferase family 4 protein [Acidobacteria bacterium]|nr:glycosyltransferase family 4 protein [Acidobacteriota bacterium]MCI0719216.1 glycosyltransferase family 4 protein [Acidobacteriota bacterium]
MRIGIDASNLRTGGGLTHLRELLEAAEPRRHNIEQVVIWAGQTTLEQLPCRCWLNRVHEPLLDEFLPVRLYWQQVKLPQLASRCCDLLFVPGGSYRGNSRPFVTMSRNLLPFEAGERRRYGVSWMFIKLLLLRFSQSQSLYGADGVIFLTKYAHSIVKQTTGLNGSQPIIPHGVREHFFLMPRLQRPASDYSKDDPFRFLYVSTIDVYKHQWHVVEAVARLREKGLPLALELVGPAYPPALRRLNAVIERVDPQREFIHYRGPITHADLVGIYHQADGFVFASSCENMPNIVLEAMASGLPIACSDRGPMPEILGGGGIYFDPEEPSEIAQALDLLLNCPSLRKDCSSLAYQRAQRYSWKYCARQTFSYLVEVIQTTQAQHQGGTSKRRHEETCQVSGRSAPPFF